MTSRYARRKRFSDMKNMLVNDMNQSNLGSAELNDELNATNMSFQIFFKSMEDRQSEIFARTVGLEVQYGDMIDALKAKKPITYGESSGENAQLAPSYQENVGKFFDDSCTSLQGHVDKFKENMDEMINTFKNFEERWKVKMNDLKTKAKEMDEHSAMLRARIKDFSCNM